MNPIWKVKISELSPTKRFTLQVAGVLLGFLIGAFLVFQVLFLWRVIPHGGI